MDMKEIKRLVKLMIDNDLTEMNIVDGDQKISLKRGPGDQGRVIMEPAPLAAIAPVAHQTPIVTSPPEPESNLIDVISPMVGTFYTASSPDSDEFVAIGDTIDDESVVCIVEAMKVMNEIKAERTGKVVEICVQDAQPVEFGQVLFRLTPA